MGKTIIIAEAGVNHNGSLELAKQLVDVAAEAGVDYVKFQTFRTENLVTKSAKQAEYQKREIGNPSDSQYKMLKKLELSESDHIELVKYCTHKNVKFLSTAFDNDSIDFLRKLHLGLWKIPSGEITNYPYIKKIALLRQPVIMSTGMSSMEDIQNALNLLLEFGITKDLITILHCNTEYPTPFDDVNLRAMMTLKKVFGTKVGYSDHTKGIEVPIAAVALGADVIEKHFTLNRDMEGPDHKASLKPKELRAMVTAIRNIEKSLGSEEKRITQSELKNMAIARKSIVALCPIKAGEILSEKNLGVKRPGTGINPMQWNNVIGEIAPRDFESDELIEL